MKQNETIFKRTTWYLIGLNLIALSVVLNIRFGLGVAAFSSVMYSISEIYHISLGIASIFCYLLFVIIQCLLSRKITLVFVLEVPLSIVFGFLTDFYDLIIPELSIGLALRTFCFAATMFITALGVFLCVKSRMVLTPTDGIVNTISEVFQLRFSAVKNGFDVSMVTISALLCIANHSPFYGIGPGTVFSALLLGRIIKIYESLDKRSWNFDNLKFRFPSLLRF